MFLCPEGLATQTTEEQKNKILFEIDVSSSSMKRRKRRAVRSVASLDPSLPPEVAGSGKIAGGVATADGDEAAVGNELLKQALGGVVLDALSA